MTIHGGSNAVSQGTWGKVLVSGDVGGIRVKQENTDMEIRFLCEGAPESAS